MKRGQHGKGNYMEKGLYKEKRLNGKGTKKKIKNRGYIYKEGTWTE